MVRRTHIISLLLLLPFFFSVGCGSEEEEEVIEKVDPRIEQIFSAHRLILDSGSSYEEVYTGEKLQAFLSTFQLDSFRYDPTHVRVVSNCRGGTLTIENNSYLISLCSLKQGDKRRVLSVGMGTDVLRFVEKEE